MSPRIAIESVCLDVCVSVLVCVKSCMVFAVRLQLRLEISLCVFYRSVVAFGGDQSAGFPL